MRREESELWSAGFTKQWWRGMTDEERGAVLDAWSDDQVEAFLKDWRIWARDSQLAPSDPNWKMWVLLCGRGFGKTRTAVECVNDWVITGQKTRICLLGQGIDDVRDVMVEGQALALDTPIPTPAGWVRFGDLKLGDELFSRDGTITRVAGVTPVWTGRPCFEVTVDGAAPIIADASHLWVTSSRAERRPDRSARAESVRTTKEIADTVRKRRQDLCEYEVPMHGQIDLPEIELPVPPYTLGAWLGNGDTRGWGQFSSDHQDDGTRDAIRSEGFAVKKRSDEYGWGIKGLKVLLRPAGLLGRKFIPDVYFRASARQRMALLSGLMDTDGSVSERGQCEFDNTNLGLVEGVRDLLLSLGYKPGKIQKRTVEQLRKSKSEVAGHPIISQKDSYRVVFTCRDMDPPFRLQRKIDRCDPTKISTRGKSVSGRLIRSVEETGSVPVRCIQVEHESGTFLAGPDYVVTHNSGFLRTAPSWFRPKWSPSRGGGMLEWPNGALGYVYSAEDPEALRGPEFDAAWIDEIMAFKADARQKAESNLRFGLRLGNNPQRIYTTTPKPHKWIRDLVLKLMDEDGNPRPEAIAKGLYIVRGSTFDNAENLPDSFLEGVRDDYEGTRLGRQELHGDVLGDTEGALWTTAVLDDNRVMSGPEVTEEDIRAFAATMDKIVVAVDPNMTATGTSHAAGITVHGRKDDRRYLFADYSIRGASPAKWAKRVVDAAEDYKADEIVAEVNQGGDLVVSNIRQYADAAEIDIPPIRKVNAHRGKVRRAEPVAAAYEQKKVSHVGPASRYLTLETQLCELHEGLDTTGEDFDRADSVVWGQTRLGKKVRRTSTSGGGAGPGILTMAAMAN